MNQSSFMLMKKRVLMFGLSSMVVIALIAGVFLFHQAPGAKASSSDPGDPPGFNYLFVSNSTTPPTQSQCISVGRRCFTPKAIQASYNLPPLYAPRHNG